MIEKWEIIPAPLEKDPGRLKVRVRCDESDLRELLKNFPDPHGSPFYTLGEPYRWIFYAPLDPEKQERATALLGQLCPSSLPATEASLPAEEARLPLPQAQEAVQSLP